MIELTPESKFEFEGIAVAFKQLAIINPDVLNARFISDNRLILGNECLFIINRMRNKVRNKILALDKYRKEKEQERKTKAFYCSSSNIKLNDYNNHYVREFICGTLRYGIQTILY